MSPPKAPAKHARPWRPLSRSKALVRASVPDFIEKDGEAFFVTGRTIVTTLQRLAASLRQSCWDDARKVYASGFLGEALGLNRLQQATEKGGIHQQSFGGGSAPTDRDGALAEWGE